MHRGQRRLTLASSPKISDKQGFVPPWKNRLKPETMQDVKDANNNVRREGQTEARNKARLEEQAKADKKPRREEQAKDDKKPRRE